MADYTIQNLMDNINEILVLTPLSSAKTLKNHILTPELIQPGLALAGYFECFYPDRIQVLSKQEVSYLKNISTRKLKRILEFFKDYNIPCIVLTGGLNVEDRIRKAFNSYSLALLDSKSDLDRTVMLLSGFLHDKFAQSTSLHGVLMDVYGVGIMLMGISGIGKSECALDLIERRHRLVADDLVIAKKISDMIIGGSLNGPLRFHLEVRGVGIIDVKKLFGICSIRNRKRIEVVVELVNPENVIHEDRSGLTKNFYDILGIKIPLIKLPTSSVSNIAKTIEVVAMRYLGEMMEECKLEEYNEKLIEVLETKDNIHQKKRGT